MDREYVLWELAEQFPGPTTDEFRHIEMFDREEDAEYVKSALDKVQLGDTVYIVRKIIHHG